MATEQPFRTTIYQEVKAWIEKQEAFEAEHKQPAPLTGLESQALQVLRLAAQPITSASANPNFVGMLQADYKPAQEYQQKGSSLSSISYDEGTRGVLFGGTTGRICRVTIHMLATGTHTFPSPGYGLSATAAGADEPEPLPPAFTTKQAAKKFAAQCAVDWLVAQGRLPPYDAQGVAATTNSAAAGRKLDGAPKRPSQSPHHDSSRSRSRSNSNSSSSSSSSSPPHKRQTTTRGIATVAAGGDEGAPLTDSSSMVHAEAGGEGGGGGGGDAPGPAPAIRSLSAVEQVVNLCRELSIVAPRYNITPAGAAVGMFDGSAAFDDFGEAEIIALREGSVVTGVAGQGAAKQAVAEKLLVQLRRLQAERDEQFRMLMGKLDERDGA